MNDEYSEEMAKIKGLAVSTAGGVLREMLAGSAPPTMARQIRDLVDDVTVKLGGHPLQGSFFSASSGAAERKRETKGASSLDLQRLSDDGCPHSGPEEETAVTCHDGKVDRLLGAV
jgi:hypothetical protein